jgi:hypothetical protein
MKTRLLFFMFAMSFATFAQFSINEGFESGLPTGWTTNGYSLNTGGCGSVNTMSKQHSQANPFGGFTTSNYTSNGNAITFSFSYNVVQIGEIGTVIIETSYSINNGGAIAISNGGSGPTGSCRRASFTIPAGAVPAGSLIKFGFGGSRQSRTTVLRFDNICIEQQSATTVITPTLVAGYNFDNTLNSAAGNAPFSAANTGFVNSRSNQPASAIRINATADAVTATIVNLPTGSAERTISFWHKRPTPVDIPIQPSPKKNSTFRPEKISAVQPVGFFSYGIGTTVGFAFGLYLNGDQNYVFQQGRTDIVFNGTTTLANVWVHSVLTFKNNIVKLYNNGSLVGLATLNLNTADSPFRLGSTLGNVEFDDLQIFSTALNESQVEELYSNNTLSSSAFVKNNLKMALYPNPVNDVVNIETETEIKSVEVYNLLGTKIKTATSKQVNVFDLAAGTYLVKIQDKNNAVQTMKFVKQ